MAPNKTCPVVFRHPAGDIQLVKGTIEPGEDPAAAALRELSEESGVTGAAIERSLSIWDSGFEGQIWAIYLCKTGELADEWDFYCEDDGGLDLKLFWHPLDSEPGANWHDLYKTALSYIRKSLKFV
jgi:8-oxo-dGTP pyrophosphatase MutT (NUDIX family)